MTQMTTMSSEVTLLNSDSHRKSDITPDEAKQQISPKPMTVLNESDDFISADLLENSNKAKVSKWIVLSIIACLTFAVCDLSIGELCKLGVISMFYFAIGGLLIPAVYWLKTYVCCSEHNRSFKSDGNRRVLLRDDDGKFDWKLLASFLLGGLVTGGRFLAVCTTFALSWKANLNIGIACSVWATAPFFSALMDYILFKKKLQASHLLGISFLLTCALLNSCSEFLIPQ